MTVIKFSQQVPDEELGRRAASGRIEITRGQRVFSSGGTVLLPGEISEILVLGKASITVEPTAADEYVQIEYKTLYPYTRFVMIPNSGNSINDTDLVDVDLSTLQPSLSTVAAWDAVVAQVNAAATEAGESATLATNIANGVIVSGAIVDGHLKLERADGTLVDSGNVIGPAGPTGPEGSGLRILGALTNESELPITANPGDGYLIGTNLFVWALASSSWVNAGQVKGDTGLTGDDGDTAYEVAVTNGFVGTQAAWLASLVGPQGIPGTGGGNSYTRTTTTYTTAVKISGHTETGAITLSTGYRLLKIATSSPARVRMYSTLAYQAADKTRAIGVLPSGDHGLALEFLSDSALLAKTLTPGVEGESLEATPISAIPITVQNTSLTDVAVSVTLTWIGTE